MRKIKRLVAFLMAALKAQKREEQEYLGENMPFTLIDSLKRA